MSVGLEEEVMLLELLGHSRIA
ncbi:MAG: hypothetical protein JWM71_939, partial [Solirubrobacteraceae bacterium]|nr:hypothetical protein [Solirubrobacteraceae bacterium]